MKTALLKKIFLKEKRKCFYCGDEITFGNFTIDHTVAVKNGGCNKTINLQIVCRSCNSSKQTKTHDEYIKYIKPYVDGFVVREQLKDFWLFKKLQKHFINIKQYDE